MDFGTWKQAPSFFQKTSIFDKTLETNTGNQATYFFCEMLWKLFFGNFVAELSTLWSLVANCGLAFNSKNYGDFFEVQPLRKTLATQLYPVKSLNLDQN